MEMFEEVTKKFGKWIQVKDTNNDSITIEDFDYSIGVNGNVTLNHCDKCIAVNKCWFKDEKDKKPEPYSIIGVQFVDSFINKVTPGLYHFKCHCYEDSIMTPNVEDIQLIVPEGKVTWLFNDKQDWIKSLGYDDNEEFLRVIYGLIKQAYCDGNYQIKNHDKHGTKIDLYLTLPGAGIKTGRKYPVKSGFMIFPNGKLKCNTILGGRQ